MSGYMSRQVLVESSMVASTLYRACQSLTVAWAAFILVRILCGHSWLITSVEQSTDWSVSYLVSQSISQPIHSINQSVNQSINQSINQQISQVTEIVVARFSFLAPKCTLGNGILSTNSADSEGRNRRLMIIEWLWLLVNTETTCAFKVDRYNWLGCSWCVWCSHEGLLPPPHS